MGTRESNKPSLQKVTKADLARRDLFGRTALHIAVLTEDHKAFRDLLGHPDSHHSLLLTDYENGWNVLHYIFYHKRLRCWTALCHHLDGKTSVLADLLKRKDRSRLPPLALIQNDAKDLMWIPGYINEKGEAHLVRRFSKVPRWIAHDWWSPQRGSLDVYMYGSNGNHHLGSGDSRDRRIPLRVPLMNLLATGNSTDIRDLLRNPRVSAVRLAKYHSVIVMRDGRLLTCGLGARGRLGHGNTTNLYQHQSVPLFEECGAAAVAVTDSHTLVLTKDNQIYGWGVNSLNQLGFASDKSYSFKSSPSDIYENTPKLVSTGDLRRLSTSLRGVAASSIHSVAYTSRNLYFWGLNIGQMGPIPPSSASREEEHRMQGSTYRGTIINCPQEVAVRDEIKFVATCESCTCVVTALNDIYVYLGGQRAKLPKVPARGFSEATFDCFKPSRLTKAPDIKKIVVRSQKSIFILLACGDILSFSISSGSDALKSSKNVKYNYVWKAYDSDMRAVDMDGACDGSVIICTKTGYVFTKSEQNGTSQRRSSMSTSTAPMAGSKFRKVENVNRVVRVSCDSLFASFAFERDDVDTLPYKLQKNDFFKDMEYLSVLSEGDCFRKQDQLLDIDHELNCYISDYIFPTQHLQLLDDDDGLVSRVENLSVDDRCARIANVDDSLWKAHQEKFDHSMNPETNPSDTYQGLTDTHNLTDLLKDEVKLRVHLANESSKSNLKFCDGRISFVDHPDIKIGFHTNIFEQRSTFCSELFHPNDRGEYFVHGKVKGRFEPTSKELIFESDIDVRAVIVLLHFIYTNKVLDFWEEYPGGSKCPEAIRKAKTDFMLLRDLFRMDSFYGKDSDYLLQMSHIIDEGGDGDVLIELADGEILCLEAILVARSAFFETILSSRWGSPEECFEGEQKVVNFENVSTLQFKIILKHLHGCHDLHVFDDLLTTIQETNDSEDFVNILLELIEIADEILLLQLKHLCELAIQEFITSENVLVLLAHSDHLSANHLLMLCCWYVYNNLEIVLFDTHLQNLLDRLVAKLERQMVFFQNCKKSDFVMGDRGEINKSMMRNMYAAGMVHQFINDPVEFDKAFMSGHTFEPLLDFKQEVEYNRRRLSSRRMSRKGSMDAVMELRKLSLNTRKSSEHAIEDLEVVGKRRVQKQQELVDSKSIGHQDEKATLEEPNHWRGDSAIPDARANLEEVQVLAHRAAMLKNLDARGDSSTPWGSQKLSKSILTTGMAPLLGTQDSARKSTKIKFAPTMKLSQKQRRKMNQPQVKEQPHESPVQLRNPWAVPDQTPVTVKDKLNDLPVLGAPKVPEPSSLAAIMLQESVRLEEQQYLESQRRTMQEIQQEQEFAKWWEEESKRVQLGADSSKANARREGPKRSRGKKKSGFAGFN